MLFEGVVGHIRDYLVGRGSDAVVELGAFVVEFHVPDVTTMLNAVVPDSGITTSHCRSQCVFDCSYKFLNGAVTLRNIRNAMHLLQMQTFTGRLPFLGREDGLVVGVNAGHNEIICLRSTFTLSAAFFSNLFYESLQRFRRIGFIGETLRARVVAFIANEEENPTIFAN